jgi:hypothetical protein
MKSCRRHEIASWIFQILAAVILVQTLYFKFTGAPESKFIFTTLGIEPWGRLGTGVAELVAASLLLYRRFAAFGGVMAAGLMSGAIFSHFTRLGIVVQEDGGLLFCLAVVVFGSGLIVAWLRRQQLPLPGFIVRHLPGPSCAMQPVAINRER